MDSVGKTAQKQINLAEDIEPPHSPTSDTKSKPLAAQKTSKKGWTFPSLAVPTQSSPTTFASSSRSSDTRLPPTPLVFKSAKPISSKLSRPLPAAPTLISSPVKSDDRSRRKKPRINTLLEDPSGSERLTTPSRVVPPLFSSASSRSRNRQPLPTYPIFSVNPSTGFVEASSNTNSELPSSLSNSSPYKLKQRSAQDQAGAWSLMSGLMEPGLLAEQAGSKELNPRDVLLGKSPNRGKVPHGLLFSNASLLLSSHQTSLSKFYTSLHKAVLPKTSSPLKPDINLTVRRVISSSLSPRWIIIEAHTSTSTLAGSAEDQTRWVILKKVDQESSIPKNVSSCSVLKEGSTVLGFRPFGEIEWDGLGALIHEQRIGVNQKILLIDRFLIT